MKRAAALLFVAFFCTAQMWPAFGPGQGYPRAAGFSPTLVNQGFGASNSANSCTAESGLTADLMDSTATVKDCDYAGGAAINGHTLAYDGPYAFDDRLEFATDFTAQTTGVLQGRYLMKLSASAASGTNDIIRLYTGGDEFKINYDAVNDRMRIRCSTDGFYDDGTTTIADGTLYYLTFTYDIDADDGSLWLSTSAFGTGGSPEVSCVGTSATVSVDGYELRGANAVPNYFDDFQLGVNP